MLRIFCQPTQRQNEAAHCWRDTAKWLTAGGQIKLRNPIPFDLAASSQTCIPFLSLIPFFRPFFCAGRKNGMPAAPYRAPACDAVGPCRRSPRPSYRSIYRPAGLSRLVASPVSQRRQAKN
jgi:hypothetical protein